MQHYPGAILRDLHPLLYYSIDTSDKKKKKKKC